MTTFAMFQCDRCQTDEERPPTSARPDGWARLEIYRSGADADQRDLCLSCWDELNAWWYYDDPAGGDA